MIAARSQRLVAVLQAFTAGYVDTVGFVGLFGLFTAHVTGNFVVIGASLVRSRSGLITKLAALPMFVLAVAATSLYLHRPGRSVGARARGVLVAQFALLAAFMGLAVAGGPFTNGDRPLAVLAGLTGVAAMAVQNAASRTIFTALAPTTVMTGNVTQMVLDLVELTQPGVDRAAIKARIVKMAPPVLAFAFGAVSAGLVFARVGFWALIIPLAALVALIVLHAPRSSEES